jgi:hypothetical protein
MTPATGGQLTIPGVRVYRACILALLILSSGAACASAQQVWFVPWWNAEGPKDFMDLFQPDAPWQRAASAITALDIWEGHVWEEPPDGVRRVAADLRRRHIALGLGIAPPPGRGPGKCGYHVEGYGAPGGRLQRPKGWLRSL